MTETFSQSRSSLFLKICKCTLGILAVLSSLTVILNFVPVSFLHKYGHYYHPLLIGIVTVAFLGGLVYAILWHEKEKEGKGNSGIRHAVLQGVIRYWLAYSISVYGFAKILKTQLQSPEFNLDIPVGELSGFALTWYYFGYSYTLAVILALFQVGGSILLLFRRTTLIGVMVLLPVMVNIVLINMFYQIAVGAFFNSVIYTISLTFLLLLDFQKLKTAFWDLVEKLPRVSDKSGFLKNALRFVIIAAAFCTIQYYVVSTKTDTVLKGTWKVETLRRNSELVSSAAWLTDTKAWNKVYFAGWNGCAFSPNPYRYKPDESLTGSYEFDSLKNNIRFIHGNPSRADRRTDTLMISVSNRTQKSMQLHFVMSRDTIEMQLARLR
ncbi:hypothetical protein [Dyadobacter sp. Leaf189]|uniref:hypothetical protein n=1 Tax=Dyadobacter sp. Leaf189 TaxID=1736295 RepID=UPI0006FB98C0|nr:hypothetical protein [Dyadobacter sp. Leaf189]KQS31010.1 hypothetical protein ASG33_11650 [Dyadobacter sp. Leaf189]